MGRRRIKSLAPMSLYLRQTLEPNDFLKEILVHVQMYDDSQGRYVSHHPSRSLDVISP